MSLNCNPTHKWREPEGKQQASRGSDPGQSCLLLCSLEDRSTRINMEKGSQPLGVGCKLEGTLLSLDSQCPETLGGLRDGWLCPLPCEWGWGACRTAPLSLPASLWSGDSGPCPPTSQQCFENLRQNPCGSNPRADSSCPRLSPPGPSWRGAAVSGAPLPFGATALQPVQPTGCLRTLITPVCKQIKCSMWAPGDGTPCSCQARLLVLSLPLQDEIATASVWSWGIWMW